MSEAPERIWLSAANEDTEREVWTDPDEGGAEYVRADIAASQVAKARAKGNGWSLEVDKYKRALDRKINEKIAEVQARKVAEAERDRWKGEYLNACRDAASFSDDLVKAEAERDRLAAEVARLREVLERVLNAAGCGVDLYNDGPGKEAIRNARAALASVKE